MSDVEISGPFSAFNEVIVRGRRVPFLTATELDGGKVFVTFDRRLAVELDASNYEHVLSWVADVMENCLDPNMGRTFNRVHEISATRGDADERDER